MNWALLEVNFGGEVHHIVPGVVVEPDLKLGFIEELFASDFHIAGSVGFGAHFSIPLLAFNFVLAIGSGRPRSRIDLYFGFELLGMSCIRLPLCNRHSCPCAGI